MYIDAPKIKKCFKLNDKQIKELSIILMQNIATDWDALEVSIIGNDFDNIYQLAHKIKASFSYFLIDHFKNQFQHIEDLSKVKNTDLLHDTWCKIKTDQLQLMEEINLLID